MFEWFRRRKLSDVLDQTFTVYIQGVRFKIRKINTLTYLAGFKAIQQQFDIYKSGGSEPKDVSNVDITHLKNLKEHYCHVFMAAVVEPKLRFESKTEETGTPVEYLITDWEFASELYTRIMECTYGKKKLKLLASLGRNLSKPT